MYKRHICSMTTRWRKGAPQTCTLCLVPFMFRTFRRMVYSLILPVLSLAMMVLSCVVLVGYTTVGVTLTFLNELFILVVTYILPVVVPLTVFINDILIIVLPYFTIMTRILFYIFITTAYIYNHTLIFVVSCIWFILTSLIWFSLPLVVGYIYVKFVERSRVIEYDTNKTIPDWENRLTAFRIAAIHDVNNLLYDEFVHDDLCRCEQYCYRYRSRFK